MRIYLSGLSEEPKTLDFSERDDWLVASVNSVSEPGAHAKASPTSFHVDIYKSQDLVVLKGQFKGTVELLCSRCADSFSEPVSTSFKCLFTREKTFTESETSSHGAPQDDDVDIEFLDKEHIELSEVLKEQLYLKVPFQPLCKEGCLGLCSVCGQNRNTQPCQCHRIPKGTMAKALRNIRLDR